MTPLTDDEFEAEYRGIWTEQSTPPCLYAVDPAAGKTRTDLPLTYRDYTMDACDGSTLYGEGGDNTVQNAGVSRKNRANARLPHRPCHRAGGDLCAGAHRALPCGL